MRASLFLVILSFVLQSSCNTISVPWCVTQRVDLSALLPPNVSLVDIDGSHGVTVQAVDSSVFTVFAGNRSGLINRCANLTYVMENGATLLVPFPDIEIEPPTSPDPLSVTTYQTSSDIVVSWSGFCHPIVGIGRFAVHLVTPSGPLFRDVGQSLSYNFTGLNLTHGTVLHVKVFAYPMERGDIFSSEPGVATVQIERTPATCPARFPPEFIYQPDVQKVCATWARIFDEDEIDDPWQEYGEVISYHLAVSKNFTVDKVPFTRIEADSIPITSVVRTACVLLNSSLASSDVAFLTVRGTNRAGLSTDCSSLPTIVDYTYPAAGVVTAAINVLRLTSLKLSWRGFAATSASNPLVAFTISLGSIVGGGEFLNETTVGLRTSFLLSNPPIPSNQLFFATVCAYGANGRRACNSTDVMLDTLQPYISDVAIANNATHNVTDGVTVLWDLVDENPDSVLFFVALGTTVGGAQVSPYVRVPGSQNITLFGVNVIPGMTLYASVYAQDAAGLFSDVKTSPPLVVDWTPPLAVSAPTMAPFQMNLSAVTVHIAGCVAPRFSRISSVKIKLIVPHQTRYVNVTTVDHARPCSSPTCHNLTCVNVTGASPLSANCTHYNGSDSNNTTCLNNPVNANGTCPYNRTDTVPQQYDPTEWMDATGLDSIDLPASLSHGMSYHALLRSCNIAGYCIEQNSTSVTVDVTPPQGCIVTASASDHLVGSRCLDGLGGNLTVAVTWSNCHDAESGIQSVVVAVATNDTRAESHSRLSEGMTKLVVPTPKFSQNLVCSVTACNAAGGCSVFESQPVVWRGRWAANLKEVICV
eukprot:TRINITY_DN10365_c0_g1_i1.p1 TRINITY_DN10365_c0_g1~~TRINITY_DN10365_c0_g1_i1.p1  ORF type:complete len:813 (-),score=89.10 TRINITY_DN10365_c0_g1_i1:240-2678(-)